MHFVDWNNRMNSLASEKRSLEKKYSRGFHKKADLDIAVQRIVVLEDEMAELSRVTIY